MRYFEPLRTRLLVSAPCLGAMTRGEQTSAADAHAPAARAAIEAVNARDPSPSPGL